jgi:hypothetical protein
VSRRRCAALLIVALGLAGCSPGADDQGTLSAPETTLAQAPATAPLPPPTTITPEVADRFRSEEVPQASGAFPQLQQSGGVDVIQFLSTVVTHADQRVWVPYFAALGLAEPRVDVVYVGSPQRPSFSSGCDVNANKVRGDDVVGPDDPNAWYCSADGGSEWRGALILPTGTFARMWSGQVLSKLSARPGDFAAAVVVAHEFGHHVADELATQIGVPEAWGTHGPELTADCFAGIWAAGANADAYLEPGDLEEGIQAMIALGVNGSATHGTPAERYQAFVTGFQANRLPYTCMTAYWPAMAARLAAVG